MMIKVKFVLAAALFAVFAAMFAGEALAASKPDANVEGLWLNCPGFPKNAKVVDFTDDEDMGVIEYTRSIKKDALTFTIRRQPIEDSELREPDDVQDLIEMRVNDDDGDEDSIDVDTDADQFSELYSYPCATAEYETGQDEDTRKNASLFIFTDKYCFEVAVSIAADSAGDYEGDVREWFQGLEMIGGEEEEEDDDAGGPDADVEGLWLRCPGFPEDAEVTDFTNDEDLGVVELTRSVEGVLTFTIRRQPIEDSELREPDDVQSLVEMWVTNDDGDEDSIDVDTEADRFSELYSYPCATAEYSTGQNEDTRKNADLFIFTDEYCFVVEVSVAADWAEDYGEQALEWFQGLEFVEN